MSKFTEFYKKVFSDESAKKEMTAILGDKGLNEATDEELEKVSEVAKKLGVDITAEEIKAFVSGNAELDDNELINVSGGIIYQRGERGKLKYVVVDEKNHKTLGVFDCYADAKYAAERYFRVSTSMIEAINP